MIEKLKKLSKYYGIYDYWKSEVGKLEKKDIDFKITDFDATIFARDEQLQGSKLIRENRGDTGRQVIINEIGLEKYIDDWMVGRKFPQEIISQLDSNRDIILTAGVYEQQIIKIRACGLDNFKVVVTPEGEDKILATIRYIIFELGYIPKNITIYEDRPEYFIEYRDLIEDVLGVKLIINKVVMDGNTNPPKITEV